MESLSEQFHVPNDIMIMGFSLLMKVKLLNLHLLKSAFRNLAICDMIAY